MVAEEAVSAATDLEGSLGASEDTDDDLIELLAGSQQQSSVDRPAGDLDQGAAIRDEAKFSAHTL